MLDTGTELEATGAEELSPPRYGYRFRYQKMRALRARRWMRQKDLEKAAGITAAQISRIEKGYHTPHMETVHKIAKALGVDSEALVVFQDEG